MGHKKRIKISKNIRTIYVGDAGDIVKRILNNHCGGNVEASALRKAIAKSMGYHLKRTKRPSGSTRVRIDLPQPKDGEKKISTYIHLGKWKYVICNSHFEAKDFQWYAIDRLKPLLNKVSKHWNYHKLRRYETLFASLEEFTPLSCNELRGKRSGPGVYVFYAHDF